LGQYPKEHPLQGEEDHQEGEVHQKADEVESSEKHVVEGEEEEEPL
jgi:hypothetical protein